MRNLNSQNPIYSFCKKGLPAFGLMFVLLLTACGKGKTADADSVPPSEMPEIVDTVATDTAKRDDGTPYMHFDTADAARKYMESSPQASRYQSGIIWKILNDNLEYAEKLLNNTHDRFLIVDKGSMRVIVYDKYGVEELNYGICCARNFGTKHKKGDARTPEGFFSVEGVYDSTDWLFTNDNGYTSPAKGQFGPRFIRLKIPNTSQIGLHGTAAPGSIGRRSSHGCIRLTNENILQLVKLVEKGMPVIVSPGPRDKAVNDREGYSIYSVNTGYEPNMFKGIPDERIVVERGPAVAGNAQEQGKATEETEGNENPDGQNQEVAPAQTAPDEKTPASPAQPVPVPSSATGEGANE